MTAHPPPRKRLSCRPRPRHAPRESRHVRTRLPRRPKRRLRPTASWMSGYGAGRSCWGASRSSFSHCTMARGSCRGAYFVSSWASSGSSRPSSVWAGMPASCTGIIWSVSPALGQAILSASRTPASARPDIQAPSCGSCLLPGTGRPGSTSIFMCWRATSAMRPAPSCGTRCVSWACCAKTDGRHPVGRRGVCAFRERACGGSCAMAGPPADNGPATIRERGAHAVSVRPSGVNVPQRATLSRPPAARSAAPSIRQSPKKAGSRARSIASYPCQ